ncbi:phosphoribosylformylglycinamidine cyclo-ligase [Anabaena cylindrica FACHB-243]|uniref:Phosphoribosylformylglycinamidine cyclo-ligase n=1 Tax=Anabaena cylindrica (strain ATCC 27899 / PCC 7122) TaxID=272123 RepID=K9ZFR6_ANACC|nr:MULTISPECIES: phosphoribosylformylglycinamidine cyclo-ligase [Anabaena]AFZ57427.1 phosphoribosylformylglycinamidine cyclo-ligase [Anabaena cylindrica PCC 7122]MBD2421107.1 phosphoribosylformylglycinamidine cyclo-ligase [Anabaena cylindrica FACHB-243]MBY5284105.1 phosphoribosylformylglycinamidine cyclo-ligase [Anabaena sp. CCAP 1446/1C]MBY5310675.1 phosphoribosylformylglycinamidine cyclo-ligase [Anabaena sp. CCAP 1446/1C]MCM2405862.1 phosphoribosylformylglycinamidine cyclo-ligase [Anabaena s
MDYRDAGVDVEAGRAFVDQIRNLVHSTFRPEVIGGLGGFGGCFQLPTGYKEPVLVSGTDGVGTKLKIAQILNRHDTVGIDLVGMCVNDVLTSGAEPLFFLDYVATGKLDKEQLTQVVAGIATGCKLAGSALLGGETAEMPGFYQVGEYDLAGFCVGIVEKSRMLDGSQVQVGDVAIGLASTGVHSNGLSLVRKIVSNGGFSWNDNPDLFNGETIGGTFLTPTRIYVKPVLAALKAGLEVHAMAHITGGGLPENLPRCLGTGQAIKINPNSWTIPSMFQWLAEAGSVSDEAMYNTFNMGIGFVVILPPHQVEQAINHFQSQDIPAYAIGEVVTGTGELVMGDW